MGKYINNFNGFVNESKLVDLASKYIDATEIDSNIPDSELMKKLVNKIKDAKGSQAADDFVMKAVSINGPVKEEACSDCQEMMEPFPSCKEHAAEMESEDHTA